MGERLGRGSARALDAGALHARWPVQDGALEAAGLVADRGSSPAGERVYGRAGRLDAADDALTILYQMWPRRARDHPRHDSQGDDEYDAQHFEARLERG
jgi:hypothetical protein